MTRIRVAVIAALAAGLVAGPGHGSATGAATTGTLRVNEFLVESSKLYIEGAFQYISVHRVSTGRLVVKRRFALGETWLTRRLAPGRYRVTSWTQSCSGTCEQVDPPAFHCRRTLRIEAGKTRFLTILSEVGKRCRTT